MSPAIPPDQIACLTAMAEPALITLDQWERGGTTIVFANPAFCALTGYTADALVGQNTRIFHGAKTDLALLQQAQRDEPPGHQQGEGWLCRQDSSPFFARWQFRPLLAANGDTPGLQVALYHDYSEVKRLREALLSTQKLDTVGMLASGVAHDFNNLLSIINGYCEIMSGKIRDVPEAQKDLHEIHRAGIKAAAIARQILEFSRRKETEVKVVNFNTLIREIADILRRIGGEDIKLDLRLSSDLGNARIDPTQFQQVLLNLCFNAREAMSAGGQITIRTANHLVSRPTDRRAAEMGNGPYVVLRVTDTGHGMEPETIKNIFAPFFTTKAEGTGLGLATVLGIVRQHNGHIAVQSEVGKGTTFEIYLPETSEPEQTSDVRLASLPATRGTETLLLIEEDTILRKMIAGILATDGYNVTDVANATEAAHVIAASELKPHLVIAPCDSKAVIEFVRTVYVENPNINVISVSAINPASALPEISSKALIHLSKPFALSTLIVSVRKLLDADNW